MRERDVTRLAESWRTILSKFASQPQNYMIVVQCLEVFHCYISWIDINIALQFVPMLYNFLQIKLLRESACLCVFEVKEKKEKERN